MEGKSGHYGVGLLTTSLGTGCRKLRAVYKKRRRKAAIDNQAIDVTLRSACCLECSTIESTEALGVAEQLAFAAFPADVDVLLSDDVIADTGSDRLSIGKDAQSAWQG